MMECPMCEGEGVETVDVPMPHSSSRDVGEWCEEDRECERCGGNGSVDRDS